MGGILMRQASEAVPGRVLWKWAMMLLVARAQREGEYIVRRVSHTQKVRAAPGVGYLGEGGDPPEVPKTDEGERVEMGMGWIYFAEELALERDLLQK